MLMFFLGAGSVSILYLVMVIIFAYRLGKKTQDARENQGPISASAYRRANGFSDN